MVEVAVQLIMKSMRLRHALNFPLATKQWTVLISTPFHAVTATAYTLIKDLITAVTGLLQQQEEGNNHPL